MILHDHPRLDWFRGKLVRTAHLMSDLPGEEGRAELDAFAIRIGLKLEWRQYTSDPKEHYDLLGDAKIAAAVEAGSTEVTGHDLVRRVIWPKRALGGS